MLLLLLRNLLFLKEGRKERGKNLLTLRAGMFCSCWFQHAKREQVEQVRYRGEKRQSWKTYIKGGMTATTNAVCDRLFPHSRGYLAQESFQRLGGTEGIHIHRRSGVSMSDVHAQQAEQRLL